MILNNLPKIALIGLVLTIIIETTVAILLKIRNKKDLLNVVLVNIVTNPIVVVFPYVIGLYHGQILRYISLAFLELLTVICEGYLYKKI